jgi:sulfate adenylyltransferase
MSLIEPHERRLINREASGTERESLLRALTHMPELTLNARAESDLELIGYGALTPLEGFMGEADYVLTRDQMRLANGSVWTIPVTLSAPEEERAKSKVGDDVALRSSDGQLLAVLHLAEIFKYDKQLEAERVYLTTEE